MDSTPQPLLLQQTQPSRLKLALRRLNAVLVFTVVIPTAAALLYYGVIASDVFLSESRFVVRNPQRNAQPGLGALLQGSGFARTQDDTYSVVDYVQSRDALRELDQVLKVRQAYANRDIDVFNRFPGLSWEDSFEAFYRHYLKHISISYDSTSSIAVLQVRAYTADEAKNINDLLLRMGERLVNNLNTRSRQDLIQVAEKEVQLAENQVKTATLALSTYRSSRSVFDPGAQSTLQLQGTAKIQQDLMAAEAQLAQVRQVAPNNPQIASLATQVEGLRRALAGETGKVIGSGASLATKAPVYDRLALEKGFAERQLGSALASLELARSEAARKQLYLERLVEPNLPDSAVEPRRLRGVISVFLLGLVAWGVLTLMVASIREHVD